MGSDILFDCPKFCIGERQLPKLCPRIARGGPRGWAVRAVQDAVETKLANTRCDQLTLLLPLVNPGDPRYIKVNVRHSLVVLCDRIDEDAERLVDLWVIVDAGAGKMGDLHWDARGGRQNFSKEHARLLRAVWVRY